MWSDNCDPPVLTVKPCYLVQNMGDSVLQSSFRFAVSVSDVTAFPIPSASCPESTDQRALESKWQDVTLWAHAPLPWLRSCPTLFFFQLEKEEKHSYIRANGGEVLHFSANIYVFCNTTEGNWIIVMYIFSTSSGYI